MKPCFFLRVLWKLSSETLTVIFDTIGFRSKSYSDLEVLFHHINERTLSCTSREQDTEWTTNIYFVSFRREHILVITYKFDDGNYNQWNCTKSFKHFSPTVLHSFVVLKLKDSNHKWSSWVFWNYHYGNKRSSSSSHPIVSVAAIAGSWRDEPWCCC